MSIIGSLFPLPVQSAETICFVPYGVCIVLCGLYI